IQSLVQVDGDVVISIYEEAIGQPGFAEACQRHFETVSARLNVVQRAVSRLRRLRYSIAIAGALAAGLLRYRQSPHASLALGVTIAAILATEATRIFLRVLLRTTLRSLRRRLTG